jgi:hypothetical protein
MQPANGHPVAFEDEPPAFENDPRANELEAWVARLDDESVMSSDVHETIEALPKHRIRAVTIRVQGRGEYSAGCNLEEGERITWATRRAMRVSGPRRTQHPVNMPFIQLTRADGSWSRLYIHPDHGPIFSTLDVNL